MARIALAFASREGHTRDIARRMSRALEREGHVTTLVDAGRWRPARLPGCDAVIVGGSVRGGEVSPRLAAWVRRNAAALDAVPSSLFVVCLSAASSNPEVSARCRGYLTGFVGATGWRPDRATVFAGGLRYSRYRWSQRREMQRSALEAGLDTDTSRDWSYTDWAAVGRFARLAVGPIAGRADAAQGRGTRRAARQALPAG
jgi:menaquinone-dependent protoporphyrinogen oxidase